jgi:hypothetical protein
MRLQQGFGIGEMGSERGLHRLEACKALGDETIYGYLTQAPKH